MPEQSQEEYMTAPASSRTGMQRNSLLMEAIEEASAAFAARNPRSQASAQVRALESSGMDHFDIPAFLRKQAD